MIESDDNTPLNSEHILWNPWRWVFNHKQLSHLLGTSLSLALDEAAADGSPLPVPEGDPTKCPTFFPSKLAGDVQRIPGIAFGWRRGHADWDWNTIS